MSRVALEYTVPRRCRGWRAQPMSAYLAALAASTDTTEATPALSNCHTMSCSNRSLLRYCLCCRE